MKRLRHVLGFSCDKFVKSNKAKKKTVLLEMVKYKQLQVVESITDGEVSTFTLSGKSTEYADGSKREGMLLLMIHGNKEQVRDDGEAYIDRRPHIKWEKGSCEKGAVSIDSVLSGNSRSSC